MSTFGKLAIFVPLFFLNIFLHFPQELLFYNGKLPFSIILLLYNAIESVTFITIIHNLLEISSKCIVLLKYNLPLGLPQTAVKLNLHAKEKKKLYTCIMPEVHKIYRCRIKGRVHRNATE